MDMSVIDQEQKRESVGLFRDAKKSTKSRQSIIPSNNFPDIHEDNQEDDMDISVVDQGQKRESVGLFRDAKKSTKSRQSIIPSSKTSVLKEKNVIEDVDMSSRSKHASNYATKTCKSIGLFDDTKVLQAAVTSLNDLDGFKMAEPLDYDISQIDDGLQGEYSDSAVEPEKIENADGLQNHINDDEFENSAGIKCIIYR
jgi:hypothetical protein